MEGLKKQTEFFAKEVPPPHPPVSIPFHGKYLMSQLLGVEARSLKIKIRLQLVQCPANFL